MKKFASICLLLSLVILLNAAMPGIAATESTEPSRTETVPAIGQEIPFGSLSTTSGCRTIDGRIPLGGSDKMFDTAQAALIYEMNTETMIYGYNPDLRLAPGALLKLLTALIAVEECSLDEQVTVNTNSISKLPVGAINAKLKNGEIITMLDAIQLMLMTSANDAALMIAEHIGGSEAVFVSIMNDRVAELGCTGTTIMNCHGLDKEGQYTTARDIAKILKAAMENETFRSIFGTISYTVAPTNKVAERKINTDNYLISALILSKFVDSRVVGGMPSYTSAETGASIAFVASDDDMELIYVIMGANRTFHETRGTAIYYGNFEEALKALDYSFDNYHIKELLYDGQALNQFPVSNGESEVVGQPKASFVTVLPKKVHMKDLRFDYSPVGGGLYAPINTDDMISTVNIWYLTSCITQAEIYAMNPVRATDSSGVSIHGVGRDDSGVSGILSVLGTMFLIAVVLVCAYLGYNHFRRYLRRNRRRRRRASRRRSR